MNQLKKDYPVVLGQDIIWGDMDAFGHCQRPLILTPYRPLKLTPLVVQFVS